MTPEYEAVLVEEAEAGFTPDALVVRRRGRPTLTERPGRSTRPDVRVDDETRDALRRISSAQDRRVSDVVREALHAYVQAH